MGMDSLHKSKKNNECGNAQCDLDMDSALVCLNQRGLLLAEWQFRGGFREGSGVQSNPL